MPSEQPAVDQRACPFRYQNLLDALQEAMRVLDNDRLMRAHYAVALVYYDLLNCKEGKEHMI